MRYEVPHLFLVHGLLVQSLLPVDLISADMDEPLDACHLSGLKEHMCAHDVVLGELEGVSEGIVDVGLCSKVHDGVDFLCLQDVIDKIGTANITANKLVVWKILHTI